MAYSDRYTGTDMVIEFTPSGGSLTVVSADFTEFSMDRKVDTVDVTAGNEDARVFLPTISSLDWSLSLFNGDETVLVLIKEGATGQLDVYPKGKVSGRPKRQFDVIVTAYTESFPFDGASEVEITGLRNGAMIADIGSTV